MKTEIISSNQQPLVVTTAHKGVFFGYGVRSADGTIELSRARMCVYWSADCKGVLGLASHGPTAGCKISRDVPMMTLRDVTAVMDCSPEAAANWEKAPWN